MSPITRRKLITGGAVTAAVGVSGLAAAGRIAERYGLIPPDRGTLYGAGETLTYAAQRLLARHAQAREFPRSMISKAPLLNEVSPHGPWFKQAEAEGFRNWRLTVDGLVARPTSFSVADLQALSRRSQTTEVVCEEGWSYIAEWIGTPLSAVLHEVGVLPEARYIGYLSPDPDQWDSLDMTEARHPQTLLTWGMNDGDLPVGFGGPLRMRVPRQLGYKSIKYVHRVTAIADIRHFGNGVGSPAPPGGYAWYAGI
jgi:DMSO/TMAO reductase YedYZ molybdopterin-dependent catalytic subunit